MLTKDEASGCEDRPVQIYFSDLPSGFPNSWRRFNGDAVGGPATERRLGQGAAPSFGLALRLSAGKAALGHKCPEEAAWPGGQDHAPRGLAVPHGGDRRQQRTVAACLLTRQTTDAATASGAFLPEPRPSNAPEFQSLLFSVFIKQKKMAFRSLNLPSRKCLLLDEWGGEAEGMPQRVGQLLCQGLLPPLLSLRVSGSGLGPAGLPGPPVELGGGQWLPKSHSSIYGEEPEGVPPTVCSPQPQRRRRGGGGCVWPPQPSVFHSESPGTSCPAVVPVAPPISVGHPGRCWDCEAGTKASLYLSWGSSPPFQTPQHPPACPDARPPLPLTTHSTPRAPGLPACGRGVG